MPPKFAWNIVTTIRITKVNHSLVPSSGIMFVTPSLPSSLPGSSSFSGLFLYPFTHLFSPKPPQRQQQVGSRSLDIHIRSSREKLG